MNSVLIKVLLLAALPTAVFLAGKYVMSTLGDGQYLERRLETLSDCKDRTALNSRYTGYDTAAVSRHWGALDERGLRAQRSLLEIDLVFPLLYGAAFLTSLLWAWTTLQRPFHFGWLLAPVALTIVSDWTENTSQLIELRQFMKTHTLDGSLIQIASAGTMAKLFFFFLTALFLFALIGAIVVESLKAGSSHP